MCKRCIAVVLVVTGFLAAGCKQQPEQEQAPAPQEKGSGVPAALPPELTLEEKGALAYISWKDNIVFVSRDAEAAVQRDLSARVNEDGTWTVTRGGGAVQLAVSRFDGLVPRGAYAWKVGDERKQAGCRCSKRVPGKDQSCTEQRRNVWWTYNQDAYMACAAAAPTDTCTEKLTDIGTAQSFSDDKCSVKLGAERKIQEWVCS